MFARLPSKNISGTFNSFDLYRAWMNVFYQLQSTKLLTYLHQHKSNIENKQGNVQKFMESKEVYPFSRQNRILIRKLDIKGTHKEIMYSLEFLMGLEIPFSKLFLKPILIALLH